MASRLVAICAAVMGVGGVARADVASVSAWEAADFRVWGYIPYWAPKSQIEGFVNDGMYTHVSDVLYFGAVRPEADGDIVYASSTYQQNLNTLRSQSASQGFKLHLSMFAVSGGGVDAVWESIIGNATHRANFVSQVKTLMMGGAGTADDIEGFNFDWERPNTAAEWGNYTQLAGELKAAFKSASTPSTNAWEVTVCDYGSTDFNWDNTVQFDANVYDQLFIMSYHLTAAECVTYSNQKLNLTGQGPSKAFTNDQLALGFGTWGYNGPATVDMKTFVAANPNLPYDQLFITGTYNDINGTSRTGTWEIESRKQVREKTQVALDRGMPGMFSWTLHYDATNELGLHRVVHHYTVVKRDVPDLNLDGKVDAGDATALANNMGGNLTNTGMTSAAQFDAFYLNGNWEKGDRDGNGFVNQADADWLATRFAALGVAVPDRLAFSGTFESFANSKGISGRWRAGRDAQNKLGETGNFKQEAANHLSWSGTGFYSGQRSNQFVTMRNQNTAEALAGANTAVRVMEADLAAPIDTATGTTVFFTFLVRENTGSLSASQLTSFSRTLSLEFLDAAGTDLFDIMIRGRQGQVSILGEADTAGQDVTVGGFGSDLTYLVVGKIAGNGTGANTISASFFGSGSFVGDFTNPNFAWMLSAQGGAGFNPVITDVRFTSLSAANYTVSNLWIGTNAVIPEPSSAAVAVAGASLLLGGRRKWK